MDEWKEFTNSLKDPLSDSMKEKRRRQAYKWLDAILDSGLKMPVKSIMLSLMFGFNEILYWENFNCDREAQRKRQRFLRVQLRKFGCDSEVFGDDVLQLIDTSGERKVVPETQEKVPVLKLKKGEVNRHV
ncbi:MAG: hypothetical protein JRC90_04780 [Deltaproteobacteria bacterium]|nr:hypothetical protein [Deltaproteobacteria bacterium]